MQMRKQYILLFTAIVVPAVVMSFISGRYIFYRTIPAVIILNPSPVPFNLDNHPGEGSADAPVTLIEFSDLECRHSLKAHSTIKRILKNEKYTGRIKYYFKSYPLKGHTHAPLLGKAILAAGAQAKAAEMREALFTRLAVLTSENDTSYADVILQCAGALSLDTAVFRSAIVSDEMDSLLARDIADGKKHRVRATPTIFINGHAVVGAKEPIVYEAVINKFLSRI